MLSKFILLCENMNFRLQLKQLVTQHLEKDFAWKVKKAENLISLVQETFLSMITSELK